MTARLRHASENYEEVITRQLASTTVADFPHWLTLSQAYLSADNKDAAIQALQQASILAANDLQHAHVALLRAKVYGILFRDTRLAINFLQQAETLLSDKNSNTEQQLYSEVLTNFAQAYNQLGELAKAEFFATQSLNIAISLADPAKELAAHIMLGRIALQNNRFTQAHQHLQHAMVLAEKLNDTESRASIHFRLGMAFRKVEEHGAALEHMQQAAALYQSLNNLSSYSYALVYIAESYLESPEGITEAEQYLFKALAISEQINNVMRTAIIKQSLGRASKLRGDHTQAARYYNEALQQFRQIGVQTYVQESALALAELLFLQQQFVQSQQIITELSPAITQAANYLQARYYDLSARLAEQQQDWQQAYRLYQRASELQFNELSASTTEKLNDLKENLAQSNTRQDSAVMHKTELHAIQRSLLHWQITALILLVLLVVAAYSFWRQREQYQRTPPALMSRLLSASWNRFCEKLQQDNRNKLPVQILGFALENSQQLKLDIGEAQLRRQVQQVLQNITDQQVITYCINSDVLWLGYRADPGQAACFAEQLKCEIHQALAPLSATGRLICLQLDVSQLLGARWQAGDLTAMREALWLGWKLATMFDEQAPGWQLALNAEQPRPCEWHSSNVRLDMLNALQLGALKLSVNQQNVPATLTALLAAETVESGK
ncbi:tetratricopeptide repeat protein [Arsukibacterium sp.]|uniref:tetratricopeptide repeat protein n=1 Tax=Arsukibacterium sp. TaxID=1977258 RepID=UPI00299D1470|nr:tetratricopeptide repeat protein [Arsukibacterium sp.]MDX1676548.1 tetratricopeptide repeat protein [Arsukibacterium sp.]